MAKEVKYGNLSQNLTKKSQPYTETFFVFSTPNYFRINWQGHSIALNGITDFYNIPTLKRLVGENPDASRAYIDTLSDEGEFFFAPFSSYQNFHG